MGLGHQTTTDAQNLNLGQDTRAKQSGHTQHGEGVAHRKDASKPRDTTHHRSSVRLRLPQSKCSKSGGSRGAGSEAHEALQAVLGPNMIAKAL